MNQKITYKPYGNKAILIEWEAKINEGILKEIISFKHKISLEESDKIEDCIVGYCSLTVKYKEPFVDAILNIKELKCIYKKIINNSVITNYIWTIPVCYNQHFGIDLHEVSERISISIEDVVQRHHNTLYTVYFIGFLPGFLYLGGLDKKTIIDRKPTPRLLVEKGSVAIGGSQTGIYPCNSAGGWNIIGKTPVSFFDIDNTSPCFAKPGDKIKFIPVTLSEFFEIEKQIENKTFTVKKQLDD